MIELTDAEEAEIVRQCRTTAGWITPEVLRDTIQVWRPIYEASGGTVTVSDAIEICNNIAPILRILFLNEKKKRPPTRPD